MMQPMQGAMAHVCRTYDVDAELTPITIRQAIRDKFGSQAALARHLGVGKPYISEIVNGHRKLPKRVAKVLGINHAN